MIQIPITGKPLKPCPFCGSTNISMYDSSFRSFFSVLAEYESENFIIECDRCSATIERHSITGAKRAWNRRKLEGKAFVDGYKEGLKYENDRRRIS